MQQPEAVVELIMGGLFLLVCAACTVAFLYIIGGL